MFGRRGGGYSLGPRASGEQRRAAVAKKRKRATKKQALRAGRTLAGRVLRSARSTVKDKRLAAGVLSQAGRKKSKKKSRRK
jgi:hypothetical protein